MGYALGGSGYSIDRERGRADIANTTRTAISSCINIVPGIHSRFWWKGKIECCDETLMIIKSQSEVFDELVESVRAVHSYQVPEIIAVPVQRGFIEYLSWIDQAIKCKRH